MCLICRIQAGVLGWSWHSGFGDRFARAHPCEPGAHSGTASVLAQGSRSMLSHGRRGTGSLPTAGMRVGDGDMPRPLARGDVLENQELLHLIKELGY